MTTFCHKCGQKLEPDNKFCLHCGTIVGDTPLDSGTPKKEKRKPDAVPIINIFGSKVPQKQLIKFLVIAVLILGLASGVLYQKLSGLRKQYSELQSQYDTLSKEKTDLETKNQTLNNGVAQLANASQLLLDVAQQFTQLDDTSVKNDSAAIDLIDWYEQNAKFYTGTELDTANYLYGNFTAAHQQRLDEYQTVKTQFLNDIDQLDSVFNIQPPKSPSSS